ncbi:hypothetical protein, partial [Vibrio parahaemolyticus]|uniref:hypothetical protein n=5 Tax=Vibrionaceae TaxID=641 RepID=UPI00116EED8A
ELTLKDIIRELDRKLGYNRNDKILSQHKQLPLWDTAIKQYDALIKRDNITLVFTPKLTKERKIVNQ